MEVEDLFLAPNGLRRGLKVRETLANPDRDVVEAVETTFEPVNEGLDLVLSPHEDEVGGSNAAIDDPPVHKDIAAQEKHLLFQQVGKVAVDSLDLEIEMEELFPHGLNADGIDTNASHFMDGLIRFGDMEDSDPFHLDYPKYPSMRNKG